MKKTTTYYLTIIALNVILLLNVGCNLVAQKEVETNIDSLNFAKDKITFQQQISAEIDNQITWERMYLISEMGNLSDKGSSFNRMLSGPSKLAKLLDNYYDKESTKKLQELLEWNERYCANYIFYSQKHLTDSVYSVKKRWYNHMHKVALHLNTLNQNYWDYDELMTQYRTYIEKTESQVRARSEKQWEADVAAFDILDKHALLMANYLSQGVIQMFPDKFSAGGNLLVSSKKNAAI